MLLTTISAGLLVLIITHRGPQEAEYEKPKAGSAARKDVNDLSASEEPTEQNSADFLDKAREELEAAGKKGESILKRIALQLDAMPAEPAEAAILAELASGRDSGTTLPFVPGEDGLTSASSWRVFLLDRLGRLNPRLAAEYARESVFPSSSSAEEWAVSLRNVLHSYPPGAIEQARTEVSVLLGQMLARSEWRTAQAEGVLEALDFVAYTRDPATHLAALEAWVSESENAATATAAQIALERTMGQQGDAVLPALAATSGAPPLRAPAMARADLRRPEQAQAVADFLRKQPAGSEEATIFFRAFPLHRYSVAPGLTGIPRVPQAAQMRAADKAALAMVAAWSTDPSMSAHREDLSNLAEKLRGLTGEK